MTSVALFHSVLGVHQGVLDAERLRQDGHDMLVVDLFDGRTFDDYPPAMSFAEREVGHEVLMKRATEAVAELPDGFVSAGFSLGCVMAVHVATQRRVSGALMVAGRPLAREGGARPGGSRRRGGRRHHRGVRLPRLRPPVH